MTPTWNEPLAQQLQRYPLYAIGSETRRKTSWHHQPGIEINLTREGVGNLKVGSDLVPLSPGTLVIVPPLVGHQLEAVGRRPYMRSVLCLEPSDPRIQGTSTLQDLIHQPQFQTAHCATLTTGNLHHLSTLFSRISEEMRFQRDWWSGVCLSLATEALILASRYVTSAGPGPRSPGAHEDGLAHEAANFIRHHFESDLTLAAVAHTFGISREHLSRSFHREFGITFHRFVIATRIQKAKELLAQTRDVTLLDIALACGFQSHAHFSRIFRQMEGMTPKEFRSLQSNG